MIWFNTLQADGVLFAELLAKIGEHLAQVAQEFMAEFRGTRKELIGETLTNGEALKVWLYENQGIRRFDAANRFLGVLVDVENLDESWKLKRNKALLTSLIHAHLGSMGGDGMGRLRVMFEWANQRYESYADLLFVVVNG